MQLPHSFVKPPAGLSFTIPDLLMLQAWTAFHDLRMTIALDVCAKGEEYEEMVAIFDTSGEDRRWTFWRSAEGIVVQPMMGQSMLFDAMSDALNILLPAQG